MTAVLTATDLVLHFGSVRALNGVSIHLMPGEILGLIGPPAAGKTTLLKTLAGLLLPTAGTLVAANVHLETADENSRARFQRRIGMAFQNDALFDAKSVYDNVAFPLRRRRLDEAQVHRRVMGQLGDVGLEDAAQQLPTELSGGMRKRVGIARASVIEPEIGLFDDPIAGLDPVTGGRILELIVRRTKELGMATVVVSNDLPVLLPVCKRVVMLLAGRVIYDGAPAGLIESSEPAVVQFATGADEGPL